MEEFRPYLKLLARLHLDPRSARTGRSLGYRAANVPGRPRQAVQFRGATDAERAAWLRAILANHLALALRKFGPKGGGRVRSLQEDLDRSSARLEGFLAADHSSPSERVIRSEQSVHLAMALAKLPEDQRTAHRAAASGGASCAGGGSADGAHGSGRGWSASPGDQGLARFDARI